MLFDPSGLTSQWDLDHCSAGDIDQLNNLGNMWQQATAQGNTGAADYAHQLAENIRNKYRKSWEAGTADGDTIVNPARAPGSSSNHDMIWLTAEGSVHKNLGFAQVTLGHTACLVQDDNSDWYYFYWGPGASYCLPVATSVEVDGKTYYPMQSLNDFDQWLSELQTYKNYGSVFNYPGTASYTKATYMSGNFIKSYNYFESKAGPYTGQISYNANTKYNAVFANCAVECVNGFNAALSDNLFNLNYEEAFFNMGLLDSIIPNLTDNVIESAYNNTSFTKP
jgi:hypothetical protein